MLGSVLSAIFSQLFYLAFVNLLHYHQMVLTLSLEAFVSAIAFIVGMMLTNNMKFDVFNIILAVVYVSLSFIFWGQGSDLYHQKVVNKIYE